MRWRWFQQGPVAIGLPLKQHLLSRKTSIVAALLCAAKTHCNSLRHSHGEHRFSAPRSTTPGRCKVAAIFYYKDNLIHIGGRELTRVLLPYGSKLGNAKYINLSCFCVRMRCRKKKMRLSRVTWCNLKICVLRKLRVCLGAHVTKVK